LVVNSVTYIAVVEAINMNCIFVERKDGKLLFRTEDDDEEIEVPEEFGDVTYLQRN
jgi:hypothetical protein